MLLTYVGTNEILIQGCNGPSGDKITEQAIKVGPWKLELIRDGDGRRARRDPKQNLKNSIAINSCFALLMVGFFILGGGGDARIQAFSGHSSLTGGDGKGPAWCL